MTPRLPEICKRVERYPTVALVLQGGGALGGYQCGVYEGLHEAGIRPNWFAGTSIGAINGAILAGTAPEERIERLRAFWELIAEPAGPLSALGTVVRSTVAAFPEDANLLAWARGMSAMAATLQGQRGFFEPRMFSPFLFNDGSPQATSFYDTAPLRRTLERVGDFDRINNDHSVRLTVGATGIT
ncbi:MAG: patatin-like phospholipase family protein, partial [Gammaproteobacteria bacterium]|nr:patatin-like phospholipase family protein [Gammaproteobacteria bacterium]